MKPDGTRGAVGVELDATGTPLSALTATLVSGPAGWVEAATVVAPEPLLATLPPAGTLIELTGDLTLRVVGGDFGSTRTTVLGVSGIRAVGSALDALAAVGGVAAVSRERSAS